jgi:gliding motility-associated-like protein
MEYKGYPPPYLSNDALLTPRVAPVDDISYRLTVTGKGDCAATDDVSIKVLKLPSVPNTFTPNGDGVNDTWEIKYLVTYPNCIVEVYNTQGQLLFRSTGYNKPWDGSFNGKQLPTGTYYYVVDPREGRKKMSGYITILR